MRYEYEAVSVYRRREREGRFGLLQLRYHRQAGDAGGLLRGGVFLWHERGQPSFRSSSHLEERDLDVKGSGENEVPLDTVAIEEIESGTGMMEGIRGYGHD